MTPEDIVTNDLRLAIDVLEPAGVLAVDDVIRAVGAAMSATPAMGSLSAAAEGVLGHHQ